MSKLREFQADRLSALDLDLSPDEFLHSVLILDPRAAGLAPAWGTCDGHLHVKAVREVDGVLESVLPFRGHIDEPLVHNLRGLKAGVEVVESHDTGFLHPQKILLDAVLGDVPVHPVPPHPRAGGLRRILELFVEILPGRQILCGCCVIGRRTISGRRTCRGDAGTTGRRTISGR